MDDSIIRFVSSGTNLLAHQAVKQMERIQELLSEEDVQKLKSVPKRRSLHKREIVRELKEFGAGVYEYDPLLSDDIYD